VSKEERKPGLSEREPGSRRVAEDGGDDGGGRRGLIMEFQE